MKFRVDWVEVIQSKTGKSFKKATIIDENNKELDVSVWPDYKDYEAVSPGNMVEGIIREKGAYKNLVSELAPPSFIKEKRSNDIAKAMEKKQEYIHASQDAKQEAIILSSTLRDATLICTTLYPGLEEPEFKKKWLEWRKWLAENFGESLKDITEPF